MFENLQGSSLDRRSFLRGSAMFAAAIGVSVLPAFAQQQPQQPKPEEDEKKKEEPKDPFGSDGDKRTRRTRRSLSTPRAASTASARSAPTTCISRAACGCVRTAVTATSNEQSD